jgi:hypothetical protein
LLRSRGGVARVRANTYDAPLKPTDHAAHAKRLGLMARRGHFLMALDRDHRFPTVLLGVSTANLRQNIENQREMTALRRSPT